MIAPKNTICPMIYRETWQSNTTIEVSTQTTQIKILSTSIIPLPTEQNHITEEPVKWTLNEKGEFYGGNMKANQHSAQSHHQRKHETQGLQGTLRWFVTDSTFKLLQYLNWKGERGGWELKTVFLQEVSEVINTCIPLESCQRCLH